MAVFCPFVSSLDTSYLTFLFQDTHFKTFPKLSFIFDDNLLFRTFRIQKIYVIWQKLRLKLTWCFDQFRNQTLPLPKFNLTLNLPSSVVISHLDFSKYLLSTLTDLRHTNLTLMLFNANFNPSLQPINPIYRWYSLTIIFIQALPRVHLENWEQIKLSNLDNSISKWKYGNRVAQ